MKTYKCLFYIGECEMVIELRATTWQAVEDAAEKLAKKLDAKYDYCVEEGGRIVKTIEEIALSVAYKCFSDYADDRVTTLTFMTGKDEVLKFAQKFLAAWLEQQESVGEVTHNAYDQGILFRDCEPGAPLFLAPPPAKSELDSEYTRGRNDGYEAAMLFVRQQSQEPVAWYDKHGMITHDVFEGVTPLFLVPPAIPSCTNDDSWNCKYCNKTSTCEALKDQRNFAQPKQTAIPEGYVLVPKEPTEAMLEHVMGMQSELCDTRRGHYIAMIAAAQGEYNDPNNSEKSAT